VNFSLVRVDNRLIHGQILEAWVPYIQANCIIIADDDVAADFFRETVIRMAVPREISVGISSVEEFARSHSFQEGAGRKTILLFSTVNAAKTAFDFGFRYSRLNIGNVYNEEGKIRCARSIRFSDRDVEDVQSLIREGVHVELRCVPKDKPLDFLDALKKAKSELPGPVAKEKSIVA
jgi:mannose/fructose/N-acetylgalactosamine-specific phosphotransferase system component IIB